MTPMLELIKLDKWFGGLQVTNNLSLCVGQQEILSVIGPNGAGKSTLYTLSYANRRRLEIARAMMTGAKLLLLDEPAAGMNPKEAAEMTELIGELRAAGYTILLIEHDMKVVETISDRVVVLDYGQKIAEGAYADVIRNERVVAAYLGRRYQELR